MRSRPSAHGAGLTGMIVSHCRGHIGNTALGVGCGGDRQVCVSQVCVIFEVMTRVLPEVIV